MALERGIRFKQIGENRKRLAVPVPAPKGRLRIDRSPLQVNLEVEVAADRDRVAGHTHGTDALAGVNAFASLDRRRSRHVGVEVAAPLPFPMDQQVVAVKDRVIACLEHLSVADRDEGCATSRDDVEALMGAAAAAGSTELAYIAADPVGALDGEDVVVVGEAAVC